MGYQILSTKKRSKALDELNIKLSLKDKQKKLSDSSDKERADQNISSEQVEEETPDNWKSIVQQGLEEYNDD
jgi:hypothetical protein